MHGNLEPEEDWFRPTPKDSVNDLWDDMDRLNALYEDCLLYTSPSPRDS